MRAVSRQLKLPALTPVNAFDTAVFDNDGAKVFRGASEAAHEFPRIKRATGNFLHHAQRTGINPLDGRMADSAAAAEMHQMQMVKMTMVMTPVNQVNIPARGKTSFNPNGLHIMLYGLKTRPVPGDTINVTLKLDDGTTVPVQATVRK